MIARKTLLRKKHNAPGVARALGRTLKLTRKRRHLTATALAQLSKVDRTYISQLERGLRQPTVAVFLSLARALELKPTELLSEVMQELESR